MSEADRGIESRVTTIETEFQQMVTTIGKLATTVENNAKDMWAGFDRTRDLILGLERSVAQRDKPNYSVILGLASFGLAFVMAVGGAAFTPLHVRLNYMEAQGIGSDAVLNHRIDQVVEHFGKDMEGMDTLFQREMRDLDARTADKVDTNARWIEKLLEREIGKGDQARGLKR